jgi:hypothetical protein
MFAVLDDVTTTIFDLSVAVSVYADVCELIATDETGNVMTGVVIVGEVRVLLVRVSVPAIVAKSLSVSAVLNWAVVPVTVLDARLIVLLVRVEVDADVSAPSAEVLK